MSKKINSQNIILGIYALLLGYVLSVALHNILNLMGYTQISPAFTDGGFVGISMFFVLWILTLFYKKPDVNYVRYGIVIVMGIACANVAVDGDFIVLLLSVALIMAFCGYHIKNGCDMSDVIVLFLAVCVTMDIFGTAMLMSEVEFDGRVDAVLQSIWMDLITVVWIVCAIYRQKVVTIFEKAALRILSTIACALVSIMMIAAAIYCLLFTEFHALVSNELIINFIILSVLFLIASAVFVKTIRKHHSLQLATYDVNVLLAVAAIVVCSLYLMNIYLQDGAIYNAHGYKAYAEWAKLFHLASPAIIYRLAICINACMMLAQFLLIRQIIKDALYIVDDRRFFAGMKECRQLLSGKEREISAIILAFLCVCVPDSLSLSEKAENAWIIFVSLNIWIALFCLFRLLKNKHIYYTYGLFAECIFLGWQYFSMRGERLAFPNITLPIILLAGGMMLLLFIEESGKTVWITEAVLSVLLICVSASGASGLMNTQIRYDEIQEEITNALNRAKGKVYYDDSVSTNVQFVLNDHMLIGKQRGLNNIDELLISTPEEELPDAINDYLDIDIDGYRILDMDSEWMPYVMEKGRYRFVGIVDEHHALLSRNKSICEKLDATDMPTKTIKMLTLDDLKIDLWGFNTRYKGYEEDEIPDEDAEIDHYLFLISVVDQNDTANVYYNMDKYVLGYHIYQNNGEFWYDGTTEELAPFVAADGVYEFEFDPAIFEADDFAEFDPEKEYDMVLDVVYPGVEWLSWDHGANALTIHHTKDGNWKAEKRQ